MFTFHLRLLISAAQDAYLRSAHGMNFLKDLSTSTGVRVTLENPHSKETTLPPARVRQVYILTLGGGIILRLLEGINTLAHAFKILGLSPHFCIRLLVHRGIRPHLNITHIWQSVPWYSRITMFPPVFESNEHVLLIESQMQKMFSACTHRLVMDYLLIGMQIHEQLASSEPFTQEPWILPTGFCELWNHIRAHPVAKNFSDLLSRWISWLPFPVFTWDIATSIMLNGLVKKKNKTVEIKPEQKTDDHSHFTPEELSSIWRAVALVRAPKPKKLLPLAKIAEDTDDKEETKKPRCLRLPRGSPALELNYVPDVPTGMIPYYPTLLSDLQSQLFPSVLFIPDPYETGHHAWMSFAFTTPVIYPLYCRFPVMT